VPVLTVQTTSEDGYIIANAAGTPISFNTGGTALFASAQSSSSGDQSRFYLFFPSPGLPANAVIQAVTLSYNINARTDDGNGTFDLYVCNNACIGSTLGLADYNGVVSAGRHIGADNLFPVGLKTWNLLPSDLNLSGYTNAEVKFVGFSPSTDDIVVDSTATGGGTPAFLTITFSLGAPQMTLVGCGM